jgi:hypothetical protein
MEEGKTAVGNVLSKIEKKSKQMDGGGKMYIKRKKRGNQLKLIRQKIIGKELLRAPTTPRKYYK